MPDTGVLGLPLGGDVEVQARRVRMGGKLTGGVGRMQLMTANWGVNDYQGPEVQTLSMLLVSTSLSTNNWSGFPRGYPNQRLLVLNTGSVAISISHTAPSRISLESFSTPNARAYRLNPNSVVEFLWRDAVLGDLQAGWYVMAPSADPFAQTTIAPINQASSIGSTTGSSWFTWFRLIPAAYDVELTGMQAPQVSTGDFHRLVTNTANPRRGPVGGFKEVVSSGSGQGVFQRPTGDFILRHEDPRATNTARFLCPDAQDYVLKPGESVLCVYGGGTLTRWQVVAPVKPYAVGAYRTGSYYPDFASPHQSVVRGSL